MPELPEVEVVRRGLATWVLHRDIASVTVLRERSVRRHEAGVDDFTHRLIGARFAAAMRRGKYVWLSLDDTDSALVVHLGMSGQCLVVDENSALEPHCRVAFTFADGGTALRFVDQRVFGGLFIDDLLDGVPSSVSHIARDPFDPEFDIAATARAIRAKHAGIKRVLLDQSVISGVGNIYADEALWRSRLHYDTPANRLTATRVQELIGHVTEVMEAALAAGGTSFDSLYVNVNGSSGYFSRELAAYGAQGEPCGRCGTPIVREPFMNRSSYRCPKCQRAPRRGGGAGG